MGSLNAYRSKSSHRHPPRAQAVKHSLRYLTSTHTKPHIIQHHLHLLRPLTPNPIHESTNPKAKPATASSPDPDIPSPAPHHLSITILPVAPDRGVSVTGNSPGWHIDPCVRFSCS
jgi:hypothetical protein